MGFAVSVDHRVKTKEFKKIEKYLDLARAQKRLWNIKVTVIPIVVEAFGSVLKGLEKKQGNWGSEEEQDHPNYNTAKISYNT